MKNTFFLIALLSSSSALATIQTVTLNVPNMNCVTCPITVKKSLTNVDGVKKADVTYATKLAVVTYDDEKTNIEALVSATTNAGYPSVVKD
ncbi:MULTISPECIES: mercury resistance system periplasmic binding protein MerP [Paraglaciecola]|uniref:Periplasmic mercury ion-binding protein n=2 Tax=Paraglaciecola TaxID=1621534 RepID=K6ZIC4_9ALTE|nr:MULTISPECIES: mercury resistance system periplasmic binding protein MerP [Paraglaciecola]GAC23130.1 periplasmic mercuric ion binding protein [Paraglaciecola mesophila KMM 241]GAC32141.1 periplasmic mercuric ion binding protein [Paraglaciecola polaris LMG 21857]